MYIYAGIDEAGYGPMFGPFIISRSVFQLPGTLDDQPANIWELLDDAVCKKPSDKKKRIPIADSKKLHTSSSGLKHLERAVLAIATHMGQDIGTLDSWLKVIAHDADSHTPDQLWYTQPNHAEEPAGPILPTAWTKEELKLHAGILNRTMKKAEVQCVDLRSAVLYEDRYNKMVKAMNSKARCAWHFVSQHLREIWKRSGQTPAFVAVDRQGARERYVSPLQMAFPNTNIRILEENSIISRYRLSAKGKQMVVSFEVKADDQHLPTALASMQAKYIRELLMIRFNQYWQTKKPKIKPTKGYVQDGRRFLKEIAPLFADVGIEKDQIIRYK